MKQPTRTRSDHQLSPAERKALALQRIDTSRTLLIRTVWPAPVTTDLRSSTGPSSTHARALSLLLGHIGRQGLSDQTWRVARALAQRWWRRQPWHTSVGLVADTVAREAQPVIRRHPWACLGVAAAVGGALVLVRPWLRDALYQQTQNLRNHAGQMLWSQLAQPSVQLALAGALSAWITTVARQHPPGTGTGDRHHPP
jgi:hypothetical protein